jgi:hypothetical protein
VCVSFLTCLLLSPLAGPLVAASALSASHCPQKADYRNHEPPQPEEQNAHVQPFTISQDLGAYQVRSFGLYLSGLSPEFGVGALGLGDYSDHFAGVYGLAFRHGKPFYRSGFGRADFVLHFHRLHHH